MRELCWADLVTRALSFRVGKVVPQFRFVVNLSWDICGNREGNSEVEEGDQ